MMGMSMATMPMPFGRYRHRPVHEVPLDYLMWLLMTIELHEPLCSAVIIELDGRGAFDLSQQHEKGMSL